ncbi:hypothetical protein [Microtetraspora niveoalba]|uniref:hypothetical protein n=1 Tax=Microtetraspora niveoalba TaxID=46175 RepID=UPI000A4E2B38|nr:hypothetical protein [Microtetraspora niveoalba]
MRTTHLLVALSSAVCLLAACTSDHAVPPPGAASDRPVADSAPYLCDLVPQRAFLLVSGITGSFTEKRDGSKSNSSCSAQSAPPYPLAVDWISEQGGTAREDIDYLLRDRLGVYARHGGVKLPEELGTGMAAYVPDYGSVTQQPYQVTAKFRCDGKEQLLTLRLDQVAKGRDAIKDLIALMRIAQKRYGEVHECVPGR